MDERQRDFLVMLKNVTGIDKVYFQPPANRQIKYPCIIVNIDTYNKIYANNNTYCITNVVYQVMLIQNDYSMDIVKKILYLKQSTHETHYIKDNLHYDVFSISN